MLRTRKLGEADRIITVLTRRHGKIRAVGKGVRRTSSKFGARLEPFSHVDLQFAEGRSIDIVTQAESLHPLGEWFAADFDRYVLGQVALEVADRLVVEEREPALQQFLLLVGALRAMVSGTTDGDRPPRMIINAYLLRAISVAGYAPTFDACSRCGVEGPHESFSVQLGGSVCRRCRPPGSAVLSPQVQQHLTALLTGDWPATREVTDAVMKQASGLISAFLTWQTEHRFRSLSQVG